MCTDALRTLDKNKRNVAHNFINASRKKKYGKDKDTDNKQAATHYVNAMTNENFGVHGK